MTIKRKHGYIEFHKEDDEYIIDMLWVDSCSRNKGIGSRLLKLVEKYVAKRATCNTISFYAEPQDDETDEDRLYIFYRNLGYSDDGYAGMFYKEV